MEQQQQRSIRRREEEESVTSLEFTTYVSLFALNIVHRYPDVKDLENIPRQDIRRIAKFSGDCVDVVLETWDGVGEESLRRAA